MFQARSVKSISVPNGISGRTRRRPSRPKDPHLTSPSFAGTMPGTMLKRSLELLLR